MQRTFKKKTSKKREAIPIESVEPTRRKERRINTMSKRLRDAMLIWLELMVESLSHAFARSLVELSSKLWPETLKTQAEHLKVL